MYSVHKVMELG